MTPNRLTGLAGLSLIAALSAAAPAFAQSQTSGQDEIVVTGGSVIAAESVDAVQLREAIAYASPLPAGAPTEDYPLVAWCEALVVGHVALGETLTEPDELDRDIMRLGRIEADSFRQALIAAEGRQTPAVREAARAASTASGARWLPLMGADAIVRDQAFGLFQGLPGRCEHAARRLKANITTPPPSLRDVGLE